MRKVIFAVGTLVAAAAITTGVVAVGDSLNPLLKWLIVGAVGLIALVGAWLSVRGGARNRGRRVTVGEKVRADQDVEIQDVAIEQVDAAQTRIGTDIRSRGSTKISGVRVSRDKGRRV